MENGFDIPANYNEMKRYADKTDVKEFESCKKDKDAIFYLDKSIASEERAIATY